MTNIPWQYHWVLSVLVWIGTYHFIPVMNNNFFTLWYHTDVHLGKFRNLTKLKNEQPNCEISGEKKKLNVMRLGILFKIIVTIEDLWKRLLHKLANTLSTFLLVTSELTKQAAVFYNLTYFQDRAWHLKDRLIVSIKFLFRM